MEGILLTLLKKSDRKAHPLAAGTGIYGRHRIFIKSASSKTRFIVASGRRITSQSSEKRSLLEVILKQRSTVDLVTFIQACHVSSFTVDGVCFFCCSIFGHMSTASRTVLLTRKGAAGSDRDILWWYSVYSTFYTPPHRHESNAT